MKNKRTYLQLSLYFFALVAVILSVVLYRKLFFTFYQQDEWMALGSFFGYGMIGPLREKSLMEMFIGAGRPFIWPLHVLSYKILPFQMWPLASFSIIMQPLIGILMYAIVLALTGSAVGAWIAGLYFLISYNGSQTVSWFATSTVTLASTFFGLLAVLFMLNYLRANKSAYLFVSLASVICSYFFKESGFMFVLFLPILYILLSRGKRVIIRAFRIFWPLIAYFSFAIALTIIHLLTPAQQVDKFVGQSSGGIWRVAQNIFFYPILSFSQLFIPFPLVKKVSPALAEMSLFTDAVFVGLSVLLIGFILWSMYRFKRARIPLALSLVFTLLSFVPYAVLSRGASYLSSRYFYVGAVGAAMLAGTYAAIAWDKLASSGRGVRLIICSIACVVAVFWAYKNMQFIGRDVQLQVLDARERLAILNEVKRRYPVLPKNPVFYVTGDHPGYYYVANQKLPFQQGIGFTILVWYYPDGGISRELLRISIPQFWDIKGQGYREIDGTGFGYYWDKDVMRNEMLERGEFTKDQIVAFYYRGGDRVLEDISKSIQAELP